MKSQTNIEYKNKVYILSFNLNVMEIIQDEYGTLEKWGELTAGEPNAKAVKFGFGAMLNEGVDIYNEDHEGEEGFEPRKYFTPSQVGRLITEIGLAEVQGKLHDVVIESVDDGTESKNEATTETTK